MSGEKFDPSGLGTWTDESRFEVTRDRIIGYAEATNDPIPAHLAGDVAPPVFAIVPVFQSLMEPAIEVVPLSMFGRIVHGEQDFRFHRPIRPGDVLVSRARAIGYEGLPNGSRLAIHLESRDEAGDVVNEQYVTVFVRGFDTGPAEGELAPGHKFDESLRGQAPVAKVAQHVDEDQTFRYGPMAFTSWAVLTEVAGSDVARLKRLAVRFAKPVLPGQDLSTEIWRRDGGAYQFETTAGESVVIKDGLAQIAG